MSQSVPEIASVTLNFVQLEREIPALTTETIFESARRQGVRIVGACGGRGTCGSCVVHVVEGQVERWHKQVAGGGEAEDEHGGDKKKWVRSCRFRALTDCTLEVAPRSLAPVVRAEADATGVEEILSLDPVVVGHDVSVSQATLTDSVSDADRVIRALAIPVTTVDLGAARQLPTVLRAGRWSLRAYVRGQELIGVAPTGSRTLGLGVDLGTTNVAAFLIDLENGRRLASLGIENPQVAWGGDVMNRIHVGGTPEGGNQLRSAAISAINALAHDLTHAIGAKTNDIVDVVVCGNTAMHHLLLGLPVLQLGLSPFAASVRDTMEVKARDLGLVVCPGAYVQMTPSVGGFVGGDHVTALLSTENLWTECTTSLVIDIGTNTEISLIHRGQFYTTSTPSGPALEGGHISCGMRAAEGAIERLGVDADGRITVEVIGKMKPIGLCGSGVLDAIAALCKAGILERRGRITAPHPAVIEDGTKRAAVLAPGVLFTQDDVRAVQLAKAAIRTGTQVLLLEAGLQETDIERFIIAGAFGAYISVESGIAIGLFPDLPRERFAQVGNAAGVGVRQMVASGARRQRARDLAAGCRYVEMSSCADFQKIFMRNISGFNS